MAADLHAETPAHALSPSLNSDRDLWKTRRLRPAHNTVLCLCLSLLLALIVAALWRFLLGFAMLRRCVCVCARACTHARVHISVFTTQFARVDFAYMRATGMDVL